MRSEVIRTIKALEAESVGEILRELYTSKIGFLISYTSGGNVAVKLLDPVHGTVAEESFATGVVAAVEWLRDVAYDYYRDTAFAEVCWPADPCGAVAARPSASPPGVMPVNQVKAIEV